MQQSGTLSPSVNMGHALQPICKATMCSGHKEEAVFLRQKHVCAIAFDMLADDSTSQHNLQSRMKWTLPNKG